MTVVIQAKQGHASAFRAAVADFKVGGVKSCLGQLAGVPTQPSLGGSAGRLQWRVSLDALADEIATRTARIVVRNVLPGGGRDLQSGLGRVVASSGGAIL